MAANTKNTKATAKNPVNPEKKVIDHIAKVFYRMFLQRHSELSTLLTDNEIELPELKGYEHLDEYNEAKDRAKTKRKANKDTKAATDKPKEKRKPLKKLITIPSEFKYRLYLLFKSYCNEISNLLTSDNCPEIKTIKTYDEYIKAVHKLLGKCTSLIYGFHFLHDKIDMYENKDTDDEFNKYITPIIKQYNTKAFSDNIIKELTKNIIFFYNYISYTFASMNIMSIKNKVNSATLIGILTSLDLILKFRFMDISDIHKTFASELPDYLRSKRGGKKVVDNAAEKPADDNDADDEKEDETSSKKTKKPDTKTDVKPDTKVKKAKDDDIKKPINIKPTADTKSTKPDTKPTNKQVKKTKDEEEESEEEEEESEEDEESDDDNDSYDETDVEDSD